MQENVKVEVVEEIDEFLSVPVAQVTPGMVACDFSKFKSQIVARVEQCKNMVLTEDNYKELANVKAGINKSITLVKQYSTSLKKQVLKPFEEYEKQAKECIGLMESASKSIQIQIDEADEKLADAKKQNIKEYFETFIEDNGFKFVKIEQIWNPKWLNKTFTMKAVLKEINDSIDTINANITMLENFEEKEFLVAEFARRLTYEGLQGNQLVNQIVFEHQQRVQFGNARKIVEKPVKEEPAPVVVEQPKVEERTNVGYDFKLVITGASQDQVTSLAKFLKENKYNFKMER